MKLATALSERSDIQKRLASLNSRLRNNARVQEGEVPSQSHVIVSARLKIKIVIRTIKKFLRVTVLLIFFIDKKRIVSIVRQLKALKQILIIFITEKFIMEQWYHRY